MFSYLVFVFGPVVKDSRETAACFLACFVGLPSSIS
jgi:hypothetical protein